MADAVVCVKCAERGWQTAAHCNDSHLWFQQHGGEEEMLCLPCLNDANDNRYERHSRDYDYSACSRFWCTHDAWEAYLSQSDMDWTAVPTEALLDAMVSFRRMTAELGSDDDIDSDSPSDADVGRRGGDDRPSPLSSPPPPSVW